MEFSRRYALRLLSLFPYGWTAFLIGCHHSVTQSVPPPSGVGPAERLPQEQLDALDRQLRDHQARLLQLRRAMKTLQEEAGVHEKIINLGHDQSVLSTLGSLYNHPELARELADSPTRFAQKRDIKVPEGINVVVADSKAESTQVDANFVFGIHKIKVTWDRNRGFLLGSAE